MPSSRPKPDCLKPPNGVETRTELFELTERTRAPPGRDTIVVGALDERAREPEAIAFRGVAPEGNIRALEERGHRRAVLCGDERAHLRVRVGWIADLHPTRRVDQIVQK